MNAQTKLKSLYADNISHVNECNILFNIKWLFMFKFKLVFVERRDIAFEDNYFTQTLFIEAK